MTSSSGCKRSFDVFLVMFVLQLLAAVSIVLAAVPEVKATDAVVSNNNNKPVPSSADSAPAAGPRSSDAEERLLQAVGHVSDEVTEEAKDVADKRAMSALRLGRRAMSALRLGRRGGADDASVDEEETELKKRKSMSMLRLGRADADNSADEEENQLDGLSDDGVEGQKRAMSALRLGRKRAESAAGVEVETPLEAEAAEHEDEKRAMSMLRLGRGGRADVEEAASDDDDVISDGLDDKRAMGMLRLGRSGTGSGRIERRKSMSMLRLG